jgi:hypothetical protein
MLNQSEVQAVNQRLFHRLVLVIVVLALIAGLIIAAQKVFLALEQRVVKQQANQLSFQLNVLWSIWDKAGKPERLKLASQHLWRVTSGGELKPQAGQVRFLMNMQGHPVPQSTSDCETLWWALVDLRPESAYSMMTTYRALAMGESECWFASTPSSGIRYRSSRGEVALIKSSEKSWPQGL